VSAFRGKQESSMTRNSSRQRFQKFRRELRDSVPDEHHSSLRDGPQADPSPGSRHRYLRKYLACVGRHWRAVLSLIGLALGVAVLDMLHPLFLRYVLDDVLLDGELTTADKLWRLHFAGGALLLVIAAGQLLGVAKDYWQRLLNFRVLLSLRQALFRRMLHLPLARLSEMKTGGIVSRLTGDIDATSGLLQLGLISPGVSLLRLLIALGMLLALNWRLALLAIVAIPIAVLISVLIARRVRPIYRAIRKETSRVSARVGETFGGIRVVRGFRRESGELADYLAGCHTIVRKQLFAHGRQLALWSTWGFMMASVSLVAVWLGGFLVVHGRASIGDIMAFQLYTTMLLNPVWNIVNSFSELQRSLAAMERVFEVLEMPADKPDVRDARTVSDNVEQIRFEHVDFEYRPGRPVLKDFDVEIPGGSVVALVGHSGAGKTTVTDLLARFHDPTRGRILLNGVDLRQYRLASYRSLLGIVGQDTFLFDGTVAENIAYGRPQASRPEVVAAAKRANAHSFIVDLPDGYDAMIGERGVKLSGGQAQRLSIARAILADPQILILDEATSNLDTESEQLIKAAMDELLRGRTTFVIAHRLSTIAEADLILVMQDGEIVEVGNHEELMCLGGMYREMVTRQHESMQLANV
jgi:ATP-binding cassette subfamily B protein/subfamily B ATP-binding cassette protein MsbA